MLGPSKRGSQTVYALQVAGNSLVGYLFMRMLAHRYGTSAEMSSFEVALSVPFIIMAVSGFTFLHGVVASAFAKIRVTDPYSADAVFSTTLNMILFLSGILTLAAFFYSSELSRILAPGLPEPHQRTVNILIQILLPLTVVFGLGAYLGGVFTAFEVPISGEFGLLLSRAGVCLLLALLPEEVEVAQVALWLLIIGSVSLLIEIIIFKQVIGLKYRLQIKVGSPVFAKIGVQSLGFLFVAAAASLCSAYMRRLGTLDGPGTVAALSYSFALVGPIGLILGKVVNFVHTAEYVRMYEGRQYRDARAKALGYVLRSVLAGLGVSMILHLWLPDLIGLLYGGGAFGRSSVNQVCLLARPVIWSVPAAIVLWAVLTPLLQGRTREAVAVYLFGYGVQFSLYYFLFPSGGGLVLVWGYTICVYLQALAGIGIILSRLRMGYAAKTV